MEDLFKSIYDECGSGTDLYIAINGRLFLSEAPQGTEFPYCVFFLVSGVPIYDLNENIPVEDCLIQFNVYSDKNGAGEVTNIYEKLIALYDWCTLTIAHYDHISMNREGQMLMKDEDNRWQYSATYRVLIEKT